MSFAKEVWTTLSAINVNEHVQKKMNLSFLSWAWAWAELMDKYPESHYSFSDLDAAADGSVEVKCSLTITDGDQSLTRQMWLPVMDHKNNSIIHPSTRHISDAKMRCLVKAMAMFGLGHYIYAGEDIPEAESKTPIPDRINSCWNKDELTVLWQQMTEGERKDHKSEFIARGKELEQES